MSHQVDLQIEITVTSVDSPQGWVAVGISPERYGYRSEVRGVFRADDVAAQEAFIAANLPTILSLAYARAEEDRLKDLEAEQAEAAEAADA